MTTIKTVKKIEGIDKYAKRKTFAIVQTGKVFAGYIDGQKRWQHSSWSFEQMLAYWHWWLKVNGIVEV